MSAAAALPAPLAGATARPPPWAPLLGYRPLGSTYDEAVSAPGQPRAAWKTLLDALARLGPDELDRRQEQVRRIIDETGITYNVYSDPLGPRRPWTLDLLPILLTHNDWGVMEEGLRQRATLLELIARDLYGPQRLLREGLLPPAIVLGHPGYLRPCRDLPLPGGIFLNLVGCDLSRAPDGSWWVLRDRLEAPSGLGYALQDRFILARVLADLMPGLRLRRLTSFFDRLREDWQRLAPRRTDQPTVAVLTPGLANETHYEHSFLARHLAFPLVEGGDLVTRDQRLYLKTLSGLQPVDVVVRRVDADYCDPLELRESSLLGVPGLVAAARAGRVAVANALGAGVLESPALLAFLPRLCQHLLGEELRLPSIATWWCGQDRERRYVQENLRYLVLRPVARGTGLPTLFGPQLDAAGLAAARARIEAAPEAWCGQELVSLGTAPVWGEGRTDTRHLVLRVFAAQAQSAVWHCLPGGLARLSATPDDLVVTMQQGALAKDTWVLAPPGDDRDVVTLAPAPPLARLRRDPQGVPSRVADSLFWMGRYAVRAEEQARLLRLLLGWLTDDAATAPAALRPFWALAAGLTADALGQGPTLGGPPPTSPITTADVRALAWAEVGRPGSLPDNLDRLLRAALTVRERFPGDLWPLLGVFEGHVRRRPQGPAAKSGATPLPDTDATLRALTELVQAFNAVSGLTHENMTHGTAWRFLDLGRRVERAVTMLELLRGAFLWPVPSPTLETLLHHLLQAGDSLATYRRYYPVFQAEAAFDLLLTHEGNPRSVLYQAQRLVEHAENLPRAEESELTASPARLAYAVLAGARLADPRALLALPDTPHAAFASPWRVALAEALRHLRENLYDFSDSLSRIYFAHSDLR